MCECAAIPRSKDANGTLPWEEEEEKEPENTTWANVPLAGNVTQPATTMEIPVTGQPSAVTTVASTAAAPARCPELVDCDKQCVYGHRLNRQGCPRCKCNKCPQEPCHKTCVYGFVYSRNGCRLCKCEGWWIIIWKQNIFKNECTRGMIQGLNTNFVKGFSDTDM